MPYRNADRTRMYHQTQHVYQQAGHTATWKHYISASAGVNAAGFGSAVSYRESTITAMFGRDAQMETQRAGGMIAEGSLYCVTHEQLDRRDMLEWRGVMYRVESDPLPSRIPGLWVSEIKRSEA